MTYEPTPENKSKSSPRLARVAPGARAAEDAVGVARERSRARDFRRLCGHAPFEGRLRELALRGGLPPVLLLTGKAGIGKSMLAEFVAALHLCETASACGTCEPCLLVARGVHPELLVLDDGESGVAADVDEKNGGASAGSTGSGKARLTVEDAACIQEHVALNPSAGARARVVVVEDTDRLTVGAANRLLKTLEEPPPGARFILTSSKPRALLPTVRSRAVRFFVPIPDASALLPLLREFMAASLVSSPAETNHGAPNDLPSDAELGTALGRAGGAPGLLLRRWRDSGAAAFGSGVTDVRGSAAGLANTAMAALELGLTARGTSAAQWLDQFERELNSRYRSLATGGGPELPFESLRTVDVTQRRALLSAARRHAGLGQIALSAQLVAEAAYMEKRWTV